MQHYLTIWPSVELESILVKEAVKAVILVEQAVVGSVLIELAGSVVSKSAAPALAVMELETL
jgi:hypothetical protein